MKRELEGEKNMKLKTQIKKSQWWVNLLVAIAVYFAVLIGSQLNVVVFSGGVLLGLIILPFAFIKCIIDEWKEDLPQVPSPPHHNPATQRYLPYDKD